MGKKGQKTRGVKRRGVNEREERGGIWGPNLKVFLTRNALYER